MAAHIQTSPAVGNENKKPVLVNKIEPCQDQIRMAALIPKEDGIVCVSDDKTVRVLLKRDSGQYWPSICHSMPAPCTCLCYNSETRRLFVGVTNGTVTEFQISEDFNSMSQQRDYLAHVNRVASIHFALCCEWVLSCSQDKTLKWYCSESGESLGSFQSSSPCTALEFDEQSKVAFVGLYSGVINVVKVENDSCSEINSLKGHTGSIRCLCWDPVRSLLYSGSFDQSVIVWDIGGQKGNAFELQGHKTKVTSLCYAAVSKKLFSGSDDGTLIVWNMDVSREETPNWTESDVCQHCNEPFFWNVKSMWNQKTIGHRQHHCRKCGKAVCDKCSGHKTTIPCMGYEYDVRVCNDCHDVIKDDEKKSLAQFHHGRHNISFMQLEEARSLLLTIGSDRVVKLWDVKTVLQ